MCSKLVKPYPDQDGNNAPPLNPSTILSTSDELASTYDANNSKSWGVIVVESDPMF